MFSIITGEELSKQAHYNVKKMGKKMLLSVVRSTGVLRGVVGLQVATSVRFWIFHRLHSKWGSQKMLFGRSSELVAGRVISSKPRR